MAEYKESSQNKCYRKKKEMQAICILPLCVFLDMPCVSSENEVVRMKGMLGQRAAGENVEKQSSVLELPAGISSP